MTRQALRAYKRDWMRQFRKREPLRARVQGRRQNSLKHNPGRCAIAEIRQRCREILEGGLL